MKPNRAVADYYRLGMQAAKATDYLDKALAKDAEDAVTLFVKGALFAADESLLANALTALKMAYLKDPTLIKAKFKVAHLYLRDGKKKRSEKNPRRNHRTESPTHPLEKLF